MDTLTAIATRRSTRVYKPEQISDSQLQTVLAAGWASPVGHGAYDELYISVVQNPKILENFAEYCGQAFGNPKYNPFYGAPTLIVISAKPKDDGQMVYIADVGCILENMQLAATDIGLGSVYLWALLNRIPQSPQFVASLELPECFKPVSALALGYPAKPLAKRSFADIKPERIATKIIK